MYKVLYNGEEDVFTIHDDYDSLLRILLTALEQAQNGKGKERHAEDDEPFEEQVICEVGRRLSIDYDLGQAVKKIYEIKNLPNKTAKINELLGAINYISAAVIILDEEDSGSIHG